MQGYFKIKIDPEVRSRAVRRELMEILCGKFGESHLGGRLPAYDGRNILYTAGALPFNSNQFQLLYKKDKDRTYTVSVSYTKGLDMYSLHQFLQGLHRECPSDTITALDIVLRELPSQNYVAISRSFFSPAFGSQPMDEGLECWRGYFQSLRPTQMGLTLNVDLSATSFYKPVLLMDFIREYLNMESNPRALQERQRLELQKALKGVRVETTHGKVPIRYRITGLTSQSASRLMFADDRDGGKEKSVAQYFETSYHSLRFDSLPCIKAGSDTKPKYLPMEVCKIVEGQRYIKKLNDKQVTQILRSACQRPADKERLIAELVRNNNYNNDKYAKDFCISVNPSLTTIEARVLPPPRLKYHDSGREKMCHPSVGQWNMINKRMFHCGALDTWACISFARLGRDAVQQFCSSLVSICNNIGMILHLQ